MCNNLKNSILNTAKQLENNEITSLEAQYILLSFLTPTKRFSFNELENVLKKPKLVLIKKNLKSILEEKVGYQYNTKEDIDFIEKYARKETLVYEWCGDWWICEDDNYPLFKECFN